MARVALHPQVGGAFEVADYRMEEIEVSPVCEAVGKTIDDVRGPALIVAMRRPTASSRPSRAHTVFKSGDLLVAIGHPAALEQLEADVPAPRAFRDPADHSEPVTADGKRSGPELDRGQARRCGRARRRRRAAGAAERRAAQAAGQGDYSTNAAMLLAPVLGAPPREIAERLRRPSSRACSATSSSGRRWRARASST